jgi:hypothetical protein
MAKQNMARLNKLDSFAVIVAVPPILATIAWLAVLAMSGISDHHPILDLRPRNLTEAAAFRDSGAVVRRIDAGEDPNRPGELRAGILSPTASTLVPIEAAAASRETGMVQLLLDLGASPNADAWQRAWCVSDAPDVRDLLASHRPEDALEECGEP